MAREKDRHSQKQITVEDYEQVLVGKLANNEGVYWSSLVLTEEKGSLLINGTLAVSPHRRRSHRHHRHGILPREERLRKRDLSDRVNMREGEVERPMDQDFVFYI